jgi:hypothetical protein
MAPTLRFSIGTVSALPMRGCLCQQSNTGNSLVVIEGTIEVCRQQGHVSRVNIKDESDLPYSLARNQSHDVGFEEGNKSYPTGKFQMEVAQWWPAAATVHLLIMYNVGAGYFAMHY